MYFQPKDIFWRDSHFKFLSILLYELAYKISPCEISLIQKLIINSVRFKTHNFQAKWHVNSSGATKGRWRNKSKYNYCSNHLVTANFASTFQWNKRIQHVKRRLFIVWGFNKQYRHGFRNNSAKIVIRAWINWKIWWCLETLSV